MSEAGYRVVKALNNNVVLVQDLRSGEERIVRGRGLGFGARPGTVLAADDPRIECVFTPASSEQGRHYAQVTERVPAPLLEIAEALVAEAERRLGPLDPHVRVALPDHLAFAVRRIQQGLPLENPFLAQIQVLYPDEYALAAAAVAEVRRRTGVSLPPDEAGFLALHLRAARAHVRVGTVVRHASLIRELLDQVRAELGLALPDDDVDAVRLMAHLGFLLRAVEAGRSTPNPVLDRIQAEFPASMALARRLGERIAHAVGRPLADSDLGYLALHLAKLQLRRDEGAGGRNPPGNGE